MGQAVFENGRAVFESGISSGPFVGFGHGTKWPVKMGGNGRLAYL
jgi:hypothetical protein